MSEERTQNFTDQLMPVMQRSSKVVKLLLEQRLQQADTGLTLKQFILLIHVSERKRPQCELALVTERDKGSLTRLVQSLERKHFVVREVCTKDSRKFIVSATKDGHEALKESASVVQQGFDEINKVLSPEEQAFMMRVTQKLTKHASELLWHKNKPKV